MPFERHHIPGVFVAALAASLLFVLVGPTTGESEAQQAGLRTPPALRAAASLFAPLPEDSLFSPRTMQRIEIMARENQWRLPSEIDDSWAVKADGTPSVDTRRLDELWHTVVGHQTVTRLRAMYRGRTSRLEDLNPGIDLDNLEEGQQILVWQRSPQPSRSIGSANRGRLSPGEPLPPGDNYVILYPHRTFGTYYTVSELVRALDAFDVRYPDAHPLTIGDISFRTGRRIRPHKSHQSGRDVDVTYPRLTPPPNYKRFHTTRTSELDAEQTLWLLKTFIDGGQVEYIFMDRYLQREVIEVAREQGAPEEWIEEVFQYPHWKGGRAIVRHARGHRTHFHLRFKCQETDRYCR